MNIQSIRNKTNELEIFLNEHNYDFLLINEHWCTNDELNYVSITNYKVISKFCRTNSAHGGVAVYALEYHTNCINLEQINKLSVELHCEIAATEFGNSRLMTIYRPPSGDFDVFLETLTLALTIFSRGDKIMFVSGDFNVYLHKVNEQRTVSLINTFKSFGFSVSYTGFTRNNHCLDTIFTNVNQNNLRTLSVDTKLSDHLGIHLETNFDFKTPVNKRISYRPIHDQGLSELNNFLGKLNWDFIFNSNIDINNRVITFISILTDSIDAIFPLKSRVVNSSQKIKIVWFNDNLRRMREHLNFLHEFHKRNPTETNKAIFNNFRSDYRREINIAKKASHDNFINSHNNPQQALWKIVNSYKVTSNNVSKNITSEQFNNYFVTVTDKIINELPPCNIHYSNYLEEFCQPNQFNFTQTTCQEVGTVIMNLKNKKSKDAYNISVGIIKGVKESILTPLTYLINVCIVNNIFPESLKVSKVVPIYKKNNVDDPSNYRPISVIPCIAKIYEIILKTQLTIYLEFNKLLSPYQYGFRNNLSTTLAIDKLTSIINSGFEDGEYICSQFLDLTKAFDCVSHDILIHKLKYYGFTEESRSLLNSYLSDRQQFVIHNGTKSKSQKLKHGVPQGSVLGPILFLIYINDFPRSITNNILAILFADDTSLTLANSNIEDLLNEVSNSELNTQNWFISNKLCLNPSKTETMIFSLRNLLEVNNPESIKFLGVNIDPKLSWENHTIYVCNKIAKYTYLLRNLAAKVSQSTLTTAYYSLIHSSISYAILVWGHATSLANVFSAQRKAIRIIAGLKFRDDCKDQFIKLKIMTAPCIFIFQCLLYVKNNENSYATRSQIHSYNTRNRDNLNNNFLRLKKTRDGTGYLGIQFFNALPLEIRSFNIIQFKKTVKKYLLDNAFYSTKEFLEKNHSSC